jgi:HEAT repeat protein
MLSADGDAQWRAIAAEALGRVGTPTAIEALKTALKKDANEGVRAAAKLAIEAASVAK